MRLADEWEEWRDTPFPRAVEVSSDLGFDLCSIDSTAAGCLDTYFSHGDLDDQTAGVLERCLHCLQSALPTVPEQSASYFLELAQLCRSVLVAVGRRM